MKRQGGYETQEASSLLPREEKRVIGAEKDLLPFMALILRPRDFSHPFQQNRRTVFKEN